MRRPGIVLCIICLVLGSGCNRFERRADVAVPDAPSSTVAPATSAGGTAGPTPPDPSDDPHSIAPGPPATTPAVAPAPVDTPPVTGRTVVRDGVENRSTVDHPGWRVELTVGDRVEYGVDAEIPVEVRITNTGGRTQHVEVEQPDAVVIARLDRPAERAWSSARCNPTLGVDEQGGGTRAVAAGESVRTVVVYPLAGQRADGCLLPAGDYVVFGQWSVCPDDALVETANPGTFVCADGSARSVDAGPVALRLR